CTKNDTDLQRTYWLREPSPVPNRDAGVEAVDRPVSLLPPCVRWAGATGRPIATVRRAGELEASRLAEARSGGRPGEARGAASPHVTTAGGSATSRPAL